MNIDKSIVDNARAVDLIALAGNYTKLNRASGQREWQGACPKCGGDDRFHVKAGGFFCRQCKTLESNNGIWYDQIDFVRWMKGCGFVEAVKQLVGGDIDGVQTTIAAAAKIKPPQSPEWLTKAEGIVAQAHRRLMAGQGASYLNGRGVNQDTWKQFNLGFCEASLPNTWDGKKHIVSKQPAIAIPWYKDGKITAIRYRFLKLHEYVDADGREREEKQSALYESDFTGALHGEQNIAQQYEELRTLVICEGEINAFSIWQVTQLWNFDVLSMGSESTKLTQATIEKANRFGRILIWMDRPAIAKHVASHIPNSYAINSPVQNGKKQDANDMLQLGLLGGLLATARFYACQSNDERNQFLWDLRDADALPGGLDRYSKQVMQDMEGKL